MAVIMSDNIVMYVSAKRHQYIIVVTVGLDKQITVRVVRDNNYHYNNNSNNNNIHKKKKNNNKKQPQRQQQRQNLCSVMHKSR